MLNFFLPWRWKRRIDAVLDAKFNATRDSLIEALNETQRPVIEALAVIEGLIEIRSEIQRRSLEHLVEALDGIQRSIPEVLSAQSESKATLDYLVNHLNDARTMILNSNAAAQTRFDTLENAVIPELFEQTHQTIARLLRTQAEQIDRSEWRAHAVERYAPANPEPFDCYLSKAARQYPIVFEMWHNRLKATSDAFDETKAGNVANVSDLYSWAFRDFVELHAGGRILDIGCGVFGRPYYLASYPAELLSGIEPLPMRQPADFEVIRGVAEYLPWPNNSFSTVISATSLDHCFSLQDSLEEITRVLRPNGLMLLWINSVAGSPKYEPDQPGFTPADQYHLFHFDKAWFEPLLEERFEFMDRVELKRQSYSHIFYNLRRKSCGT